MKEVCPISFMKVNEKLVKLNTLFVIISILIFLFTPLKWIIYLLVFDFALRAANKGKYSPFTIISKNLINLLKLKPTIVDAKPKLFAARIGLVLCILIALMEFFKLTVFAVVFSLILLSCATLELSIGFCVGCKIYYIIYNLSNKDSNV